MTITDFCDEINNYFVSDRKFGTFTITNGALTGADDFLRENQYFRIVNSAFNDGVYKYPITDLTNETFDGAIWAMAVPPAALALLEKMQEWDSLYGNNAANYTPYASETMHHYSRSFAISTNSKGELVRPTWQAVFRTELNRWRKI